MSAFVAVILAAGYLTTVVAAHQTPATGSSRPAAPAVPSRACSLLTKADVKKLAAADDQFFDMVPPREESLGESGSACFYSGITIQIDPFPPSALEAHRKKSGAAWKAVSGVADMAYLNDNKPGASLHYLELYGVVGGRVFTIQKSVRPPEASPDTVRPGVEALAKAIAAKLR